VGWRLAHLLDPAGVGANSAADVGVQAIGDAAISAQLAEALGDERVDRMGQPGSEVVFDLVIESAHHPAQQRYPTATSTVVRSWCSSKSSPRRGSSGPANWARSTQWASWKVMARVKPTTHEQTR
jgi:hypothetical protein